MMTVLYRTQELIILDIAQGWYSVKETGLSVKQLPSAGLDRYQDNPPNIVGIKCKNQRMSR
jgi:hypothetical protein